ncbi:MAG TPA: hypothetical protein VFN61_11890, partial [Acidimicrobiales bacterium]|nr:hypothetical protein [Acidimicrobiales bacterium]
SPATRSGTTKGAANRSDGAAHYIDNLGISPQSSPRSAQAMSGKGRLSPPPRVDWEAPAADVGAGGFTSFAGRSETPPIGSSGWPATPGALTGPVGAGAGAPTDLAYPAPSGPPFSPGQTGHQPGGSPEEGLSSGHGQARSSAVIPSASPSPTSAMPALAALSSLAAHTMAAHSAVAVPNAARFSMNGPLGAGSSGAAEAASDAQPVGSEEGVPKGQAGAGKLSGHAESYVLDAAGRRGEVTEQDVRPRAGSLQDGAPPGLVPRPQLPVAGASTGQVATAPVAGISLNIGTVEVRILPVASSPPPAQATGTRPRPASSGATRSPLSARQYPFGLRQA